MVHVPWSIRLPKTARPNSFTPSQTAAKVNKRLFTCMACTILLGMQPIPPSQQTALVDRLAKMCGGGYSPEIRRKYFISGPQWAAAYQGQALFYAPTREPITFEDVIREFGKIGIGYWCTHDSDVIPTSVLGTSQQPDIGANIG